MKDKYGREITEDTLITDLPKELAEKLVGELTLGQIYFAEVSKAHERGDRPLRIDQWGAEMGERLGVRFIPPVSRPGMTTYRQFGQQLGMKDGQMRALLAAFAIDGVEDLASPMPETHADILGLKADTRTCFVATVVFEDERVPEVNTLRRWRDSELSRTWPGRVFISGYYRFGPIAAMTIQRLPGLRLFLRQCLTAVVERIRSRNGTPPKC